MKEKNEATNHEFLSPVLHVIFQQQNVRTTHAIHDSRANYMAVVPRCALTDFFLEMHCC